MAKRMAITMAERWEELETDGATGYFKKRDGHWETWDDAKSAFTGDFPNLIAAVDHRIRQRREQSEPA